MSEQDISYVITNAGNNIISRVIAGLNITFKRIAIGDGYDYDITNYVNHEQLINEVLSLNDITMLVQSDNMVELIADFTSSDLNETFWFREIGVYIVDPDNEENEILFAYGNRNENAEYITPHVDNYKVLKNIRCLLNVGASTNIKVYINNNKVSVNISFKAEDWVFNDLNNLYNLPLGNIQESIKVYRKTLSGYSDTGIVDIVKGSGNSTTLKSLIAFDGYVTSV